VVVQQVTVIEPAGICRNSAPKKWPQIHWMDTDTGHA
jgi:hypothetical protein